MKSKPVVLDLFCGAGGAAMGYCLAGLEISIGLDIEKQRHYPFPFQQMDALEALKKLIQRKNHGMTTHFDLIHASPPCQQYSCLRHIDKKEYPDYISELRELLIEVDIPYVIENVVGAPLIDPVLICGTERGLGVGKYRLRRHRLFECSFPIESPGCKCQGDKRPIIDVTGHGGARKGPRKSKTGGGTHGGTADERRQAMQTYWMSRDECAQAIPPAYTRLVGEAFLCYNDSHV